MAITVEELKTNNMARINGSGFKMKQSPVKGKLDNFFSSLGKQLRSNKKDIGAELKSKYKGTKQTTNKAGETIGHGDTGYDLVFKDDQANRAKRTAKGSTQTLSQALARLPENVQKTKESTTTELTDKQITAIRAPESTEKATKLSKSGTDARKKQYDAKGWRYDETIKGYNRDGTEIKKKKKKEKVDNKKIILQAIPRVNREENLIEDKKTTEEVKKGFDFNKANDYSSSAVFKKSPYKKGLGSYAKKAKGSRGYKMKK